MKRKELYSFIELNHKRHDFTIRKLEKSYNLLEVRAKYGDPSQVKAFEKLTDDNKEFLINISELEKTIE